ncbi:vacuolar protein sorting-associated protein 33B [Nilaparvata lugens]|uniref:vacuolar protein sorting-associated protein 33B n=1 Tax=Nilaparvata lugens TaxID=108931 RepID=UPI00193E27AB|nr:vacuolar protein sorting-associated protein 33B [Nilaparvata lugens]
MQCSLENRICALNQISSRKLVDILDKIPGQKDFIIDSNIIKPLEKFIGVSKLRSHGVDKIYKFDKPGIPITNSQRVYMIRSDLITAKHVSDQINSEINQSPEKSSNNHIIIVPRKLTAILDLFEEEGVFGHMTTYQFQWAPLQLDSKLIIDELPNVYRSLFLEGNNALLPSVAKSIWTLIMLFGIPTVTVYHGKFAQQIEKLLGIYLEKLGRPHKVDSDISCFYLVDRDVDYTCALLTPGTYTCLLDEVCGFTCGVSNFTVSDQNYTLNLSDTDEIFVQVRNRYFSDVFPYLSSKAKVLRDSFALSQSTTTLDQMQRFVSQELRSVTVMKKCLAGHIAACEKIMLDMSDRFEDLQVNEQNMLMGRNRRDSVSFIEDCIAMDSGGLLGCLRLLSLLSTTSDGLTADEIASFKNQLLHAYGYKHLSSIHNLFTAGLITEQVTSSAPAGKIANKVVQAVTLPTRRSSFNAQSQKLKLLPETCHDPKNPKDMSYIFGGAYIPLICQIISNLVRKEVSLEEITKLVPNLVTKYSTDCKEIIRQTYLIYFIGGVTFAEVTAFQMLEKLTGCQIVVAGTSIVNGSTLIKSVL